MPANEALNTPSSSPAVAFHEVAKGFNRGRERISALQQLSFEAAAGRITGLVGPDGAGKTTIMRLCAGLLLPDAGHIRILGQDTAQQSAAIHARQGYMPQRFGLYEDLTVAENLRLYADLHGMGGDQGEERLQQLLSFTGLGPFTRRLAGRLSGGMKQKLGLACVLMQRPALLLLDEPTVGVDPVSRQELWRMIHTMMEAGTAVLVSTAYLEEAERCHEVLMLHQGRLLDHGPPADFRARLAQRTYSLPAQGAKRRAQQEQLRRQPGVMDAIIQGGQIRLLLAKKARLEELDLPAPAVAATPRFEDAFLDLLAAHARNTTDTNPDASDSGTSSLGPPQENAAGEAVISMQQVRREFGTFVAVRDVDLDIRRGEIFGLLGPNGAGKSTAIRMLCGLLPPSAGRATVVGLDLARAPGKVRARIGYMSQRFSLYRQLSVSQNLRFFAGSYNLRRREREQRISQALHDYGLQAYADAASATLPLGYQQRLALACALLHRPEIVFLDEPTSGVDPLARREFWSRINALAEQGVTVLVTTHFIEEAEYCDRVAIMYEGRVIAKDTPERLKAAQQQEGQPPPSLESVFVHLVEQEGRRP